MYVDEPPNIFRPTIRRAYCTGIRRCPCSMKMTAATSTNPMAIISVNTHQPLETRTPQTDGDHQREPPPALGDPHRPNAGREGGDDLGEDQDRHAVADAAVGDQL